MTLGTDTEPAAAPLTDPATGTRVPARGRHTARWVGVFVLVIAAGDLAALAVGAELFELAQWGLAQARLGDPYSEPLSRAAMQVAAAAGDVDRLRREWDDYRRRMDELDPGGAPPARAARLYGELSRLVLVGARPAAR